MRRELDGATRWSIALSVVLLVAACGRGGGTSGADLATPAAEVDAAVPDLAAPVDAAAAPPDLATASGVRVRIVAANITSGG